MELKSIKEVLRTEVQEFSKSHNLKTNIKPINF